MEILGPIREVPSMHERNTLFFAVAVMKDNSHQLVHIRPVGEGGSMNEMKSLCFLSDRDSVDRLWKFQVVGIGNWPAVN